MGAGQHAEAAGWITSVSTDPDNGIIHANDAVGAAKLSPILIAITGVIYLWVAADLAYHHKLGLALAYLGYAFANVGLYLAAKS